MKRKRMLIIVSAIIFLVLILAAYFLSDMIINNDKSENVSDSLVDTDNATGDGSSEPVYMDKVPDLCDQNIVDLYNNYVYSVFSGGGFSDNYKKSLTDFSGKIRGIDNYSSDINCVYVSHVAYMYERNYPKAKEEFDILAGFDDKSSLSGFNDFTSFEFSSSLLDALRVDHEGTEVDRG